MKNLTGAIFSNVLNYPRGGGGKNPAQVNFIPPPEQILLYATLDGILCWISGVIIQLQYHSDGRWDTMLDIRVYHVYPVPVRWQMGYYAVYHVSSLPVRWQVVYYAGYPGVSCISSTSQMVDGILCWISGCIMYLHYQSDGRWYTMLDIRVNHVSPVPVRELCTLIYIQIFTELQSTFCLSVCSCLSVREKQGVRERDRKETQRVRKRQREIESDTVRHMNTERGRKRQKEKERDRE